MHEITQAHRELVAACRTALGGWRRFIIGVDGLTHTGKSTMGRLLAWQLGMPCVETDMFLTGEEVGQYDFAAMKNLIDHRLEDDRPVIVEGITLLRTLREIRLEADYLVCMRNNNRITGDSPTTRRVHGAVRNGIPSSAAGEFCL